MFFGQIEEEPGSADSAVALADKVEINEGKGEGVEAGIARRSAEGGNGLLPAGEEGGGVKGALGVFEVGLPAVFFEAPGAEVAVEKKREAFGEDGAMGFFKSAGAAAVGGIDQRDADGLFAKTEGFKLQAFAGRLFDIEDAAAPEALFVPSFEPEAFVAHLEAEMILKQGKGRGAAFEQRGELAFGEEVFDGYGEGGGFPF